MLLRHLLSIALLPFVVVVVVPRVLLERGSLDVATSSTALLAARRIAGDTCQSSALPFGGM